MNEQELLQIIKKGESSKVQFKERLPHADSFAHELIAFSNSQGGIIVIGVSDKTGALNGLSFAEIQQINQQIVNIASQKVYPPVYLTTDTITVNDNQILVVTVDEGLSKPYKDSNGIIYLKNGSDKRKVTSAVMFTGNEISSDNYRSKPEDFTGNIPELFKQGMLYVKSCIKYVQKENGFNSKGLPEISIIALEEIIQNALVHRDYFKNAPVRLLVFDNRIEIISPGKLPNSLTVEEVKYGNPVIRNNQIALFASRTLPYSGLGSGIRRALANQPDMELVNDIEGEQFIVSFPRERC